MKPETLVANIMLRVMERLRKVDPRMEAQAIVSLCIIATQPDITVSELGKKLNITIAGVSRNVTKLCDVGKGLGFIVRYEDPVDRRHKRVRLTRKGEQLFTDLGEDVQKLLPEIQKYKEGA